jgi:hypothetical protein
MDTGQAVHMMKVTSRANTKDESLFLLGQEVTVVTIASKSAKRLHVCSNVRPCVDFEFTKARHTRGQPPSDGQDHQGLGSWPLLFYSGQSRPLCLEIHVVPLRSPIHMNPSSDIDRQDGCYEYVEEILFLQELHASRR